MDNWGANTYLNMNESKNHIYANIWWSSKIILRNESILIENHQLLRNKEIQSEIHILIIK